MSYNNMINRDGASALIPEEVAKEIINGVRKQSVAMSLMRKLPNMKSGTMSQPVLSMLPVADFVNGDAGMKVTSNAAWDKKVITAGEIAVIIPIPQAVIDDADYDIWGEVRPLAEEAIARKFDRAVLSERNAKAPSVWPDPIIPAAIASNNKVALGTGTDAAEDISAVLALLEEKNYDVTGFAAQTKLKAALRNLRDANGTPIYQPITSGTPDLIYGLTSKFVSAGTWNNANALAIAGDWSKAVYSIRQDITYKIFDTGVISDDDGNVVYNLMQQDMLAMRIVMRAGWQIADPVDIDRAYGTSYPFAVLQPEA